jgi:hypothetical protein
VRIASEKASLDRQEPTCDVNLDNECAQYECIDTASSSTWYFVFFSLKCSSCLCAARTLTKFVARPVCSQTSTKRYEKTNSASVCKEVQVLLYCTGTPLRLCSTVPCSVEVLSSTCEFNLSYPSKIFDSYWSLN